MFRLTFFLGAGIYLALLLGGADHGQKRYGLMDAAPVAADRTEPAAPEAPEAAPVVAAEVPAAPSKPEVLPAGVARMPLVSPAAFEPAPGAAVFTLAAPDQGLIDLVPDESSAAALSGPVAEEGASGWAVVVARSVNVRSGPSTGDSITGRLVRGDEVVIVEASADQEGWVHVRVEGDGVEGFVAARFLAERPSP